MTKNIFRKRPAGLFILKIDIPALFAFALFAGLIFFYLIPGFEKAMMDRKRNLIHEMTSSAYSILEYYHSLETRGDLSIEEAKGQAISAIRTIRYGETLKDYFWITDKYPRMVEHPYRPDLNGKDLNDYHDSKGKTIFVEFVKAVSATGESYVDYMWQWNDDSTRIVPKSSYVRLFEPWGWIIGTGIYIEDVKAEIHRIELNAFIISGVIGVVIIIILIAISRQSHKIEEERTWAEEELRKSRELYRTLAEAASEGVMIWSGKGLQANKTLLSLLGYTEEEFQSTMFRKILSSGEFLEISDAESLYEELSTRRYVECTLIMKKGDLIKSHADFSRILLGGMKAVMVVVRPVKSTSAQNDFTPPPFLLEDISTGFFRTTYGKKNKFLYATKPVLDILGFQNLQELLTMNIESFFVNPVQVKAFRLALESKENILKKEVLLKRQDGDEFWALINVMVVEFKSDEIWCEGSIESLAASSSTYNIPVAGMAEYSASFIMRSPVAAIMQSPVKCAEDVTVARVISTMKENNNQSVIVTNKEGEPMGVIDAGTIAFRLSEGESTNTEIFRWMSSPPDFINIDATIEKAFGSIQKSVRKFLIVSSENNQSEGVITQNELSGAFFTSPALIVNEIMEAGSSHALRRIFTSSQKMAVSMILGHADPYAISLYLSTVADAICNRIISICVEAAGEPPCHFSFIQTGSTGRMEQSFLTDQDNAIIFENCEDEKLDSALAYFLPLGKKINEMLSETGYRLCKGGNMAGNPKWCQPVNRWKRYFSEWINMPGPEEILDISIFFDFRFCYGDSSLSDELREFVKNGLRTNDIFFHYMASALKAFNPSASGLAESSSDIKKLLIPLTGIIRLYALKFGLSSHSSLERIIELYSVNSLDYKLLRESSHAWKNLTSLRLSHQASYVINGREPDNYVNFQTVDSELLSFAEQSIKTINNLILKVGNDFYTENI